ncbi:MAG: FecR domain-containing protein [Desulfovibrionaceae bacterium]|nr:FecR domain-containing protein [Desulfovibrionaceae bacterium]
MTRPKRFILLLLAAALLACLVPVAALGAERPGAIGEVVYLVGTVTAERPGGAVRDLDLKKPVMAGDVVVTGSKSNVEIVFQDDSVFSQGPDARISMDEFVYTGQKSASKLLFRMGQGTFRYVTGQIVRQNPDAFALQTPTATIGIRGTEVFATVTPGLERIGNLELTAGHTMTVGSQRIDKPMYAVSVDPKTGEVSAPGPVSADEARAVINAAPQTTQGESGTSSEDVSDMSRRADALGNNIDRTKENLSTGKPHYPHLHILTLQQQSRKTAGRDTSKAEKAGKSSEGGGDGGHP